MRICDQDMTEDAFPRLVVADCGTRWAGEGTSVRGLRWGINFPFRNQNTRGRPEMWGSPKQKFGWIHVDGKMFLLGILEGDLHPAFALSLWWMVQLDITFLDWTHDTSRLQCLFGKFLTSESETAQKNAGGVINHGLPWRSGCRWMF